MNRKAYCAHWAAITKLHPKYVERELDKIYRMGFRSGQEDAFVKALSKRLKPLEKRVDALIAKTR